MQRISRKVGPEVQNALAKQQAEQTQDLALLQEQLDGLKKTLDQQKTAAQKMEQVWAKLVLVLFLSHCYTHCCAKLPLSP
jgi:ABC-type phosphate transport system auxiliary subunit